MRIFRFLCVGALAAYLAAAGYLFTFQRSFVFKPSGSVSSPAEENLAGVLAQQVTMADGTIVPVWRAPPAQAGLPTVLYFHGNSGTLAGRASRFAEIIASGFGLYAPGYRGFAGAGGTPSEASFVADALVHFDRLLAETDGLIVVHGESLGAGVASALATKRNLAALVLEAPFTAAVDIAAASYPWLPVGLLMRDPFLSRENMRDIAEPVLIVHGTKDEVIPVEHGRVLFDLANEPRRLAIIEGAGHGNLWPNGMWAQVRMFLIENGVTSGN